MYKVADTIKKIFNNVFLYNETIKYNFTLEEAENNSSDVCNNVHDEQFATAYTEEKKIFKDLNENLKQMKVIYNSLINSDIVIREFKLIIKNVKYNAFLIYIDGMVDTKLINDFILSPLMMRNKSNTYEPKNSMDKPLLKLKKSKSALEDYVFNNLIPQNSIKKINCFQDIVTDINSGNSVLFIDTLGTAFSIESKGFQIRSISKPSNEIVVRGSQEAFIENIRTNTSILRRLTNNENLVIENIDVGKISKTKVAVCYLKNIANDDLVSEVKFRINNLAIDSLLSSGQLEQLIQDDDSSFPQIIATERPDKTVNHLYEGRVAIIVNGSPYVLIVPGVLIDFFSSSEDLNLKPQYSNILRFIRLIASFFALLLPGLYISITIYHQELIPTHLLFAISSTRETVPFPIIAEIILMEISFELIREARSSCSFSYWAYDWDCWCFNFR